MRRALRAALAGAAAAGLVLAAAAPASAHNFLVSTTPAENEVLTELPEAWEVVTNETLLYVGNDEVFGLWTRDADGRFYGDGCVTAAGPAISAPPAIGEPGAYTLVYAFVSADGHPLTGEIPFEWAPTGDYAAATGTAEPTRCGALPEETTEAVPVPGGATGLPADVWWIAGALAAVLFAVGLTVLLARRRPRAED